ncbi:unnamed protein product [Gemmata massiliana]|uniref:Uncharacterized protein n=1 Tax=Gemmata massiliana TaxID=1210884 RepID=A0A6P2CTW3_9BACT|nr:unnamed protein product [Gemmata massiliana]
MNARRLDRVRERERLPEPVREDVEHAFTIRRPPVAPRASTGVPSFVTTAGHMLCSGRLPGAGEFARPGRGSNRDTPWPSTSPNPSIVTCEPKYPPWVNVSATVSPEASTVFR